MTGGLPFHPLANLFPLIEGADFRELVGDIAANGLREPIVLLDGQVLDGRNRYRACLAAEIEPHFESFDGSRDDPLAFVVSRNLNRRHLDAGQRAMVAARLATMRQGERTDRAEPSANLQKVSRAEAAAALSISERSIASAAEVIGRGAPELVAAVERGGIAVSAAASLASLSIEEQRRVIETADRRAIGGVAKKLRDEKQEEKKRQREARERGLAARQRGLPEKRYGVIYADPEWRFEVWSAESGMDRAADNHYPTSDTNDIVLRPVGDIAAKDCVLFLWATAPMLPHALRVMAGWGFTYKTHVVWLKDRQGTGYWFRNEHELLLVGTRGDIPAPAMGTQFSSLIEAPLGAHSEKPDAFAALIEAYFPTLPKIELNARRQRPGWDVWGLEAPEDQS